MVNENSVHEPLRIAFYTWYVMLQSMDSHADASGQGIGSRRITQRAIKRFLSPRWIFFWGGSCFSIIKSMLLSPFFKGLDRLPTLKFPCCMLPLGKVWGCHTPPRWYRKAGFSWKAQRIWPFISRPTRQAIAVLQFKGWRSFTLPRWGSTWWNRRALRFPVVANAAVVEVSRRMEFSIASVRRFFPEAPFYLLSDGGPLWLWQLLMWGWWRLQLPIRKCHRFWPIDKTKKA